ncbi:DUF4837 family protein [Flavobacterium muglaense]|uniref:DUF4837 family protein n=1 Tax=Flavobacterium muglaense TaxID=2764716 RepID=A0A923MZF4_9FLAO|nr:DUF4837 family protein [Flavobacterium muglaense]MBC5837903.1 DUF4837 family protein [Flavobacterium muglaense]MBC5844372.1 DUF4837 family protein [Flavobacterium muglaense]
MNKSYFFYFLLLNLIFSCKNNQDSTPHKTTGVINTISVIIDDQLWNGEVGDSIRNKFASPVIGLPQEEPLFSINQYPAKLMEGFMTDTRNIIVVKKGDENKFEIVKDQYASPQNVFHIEGTTAESIIAIIQENSSEIIRLIREIEIQECQRINKKSLRDSQIISDTFHATIDIPSTYNYVIQKKNFIWLKKEIVSGNTSLLLYQVPLNAIKKEGNLVSNIIRMRDSIGALYIHGKEPNTELVTEEAYAPYFFQIKLDGKPAYETKGTWELKNDFMSGPFINYAIIDKKRNRVLILEGFSYAPSKEKRDLMQELESIIKSVKINQ